MIEQIAVVAVPAAVTLVGVLTGQYVSYEKAKQDRQAGMAENRAVEDEWKKRLEDRLDHIDEKMDEHGKKLDKHNGFEGRIIALEVIAEWIQNERTKK